MDCQQMETRRRWLMACAGATAGVATLAGCTSDNENGDDDSEADGETPDGFDEGDIGEYGVWPMAHYDAANTAVAPNSGPDSKPEEEWSIEFDGDPTSPVVADGVAYVGVRNNPYYAVDIEDGEKIWDHQTGEFDTPVVSEKAVFVSGDGIEALNRENGEQMWTSDHNTLSNLRMKGNVIYGQTDQYIYGVDTESGKEVLEIKFSSEIVSFSIDDDRIYVKTHLDNEKYRIEGYEKDSGDFLWDYETTQSNWGDGGKEFPVIDGEIYTRNEKTLIAIDTEDGEDQEIREFELNLTVSVTVLDGCIYIPMLLNDLPAVNAESGEEIPDWDWDPLAGRVNWRTPITDSTLYVWVSRGVSTGFVLIAADAKTGEQKWEYESDLTGNADGPIILEDLILFSDNDNKRLVAIS